ncbi:MAG TPA: nucleotidyl transferase AbiEii/AbiGii toxin family protein [Myxococcota bacterium]|nr:nucleotidyl transferase AbiEii/AbiGii toxin family protein [Myxococcota bacterium]
MIPKAFIDQWRAMAPWVADHQVEQDLIISRALVELYSDPFLRERLAFRGGTALYKLHLSAARYSEDIDLVQTRPEPIGDTLNALRARLDPWLGSPKREFSDGRVTLSYRLMSEGEPSVRLKLKVEINSREHFAVFGLQKYPFRVQSRWFTGEAEVTGYTLDEQLGTKLRALYQRRKGRDLFDLWDALTRSEADPDRIVVAFLAYMKAEGHAVHRAEFEENLAHKLADTRFTSDVRLLLRAGVAWDVQEAAVLVGRALVARLPGEAWRGFLGADRAAT